jgi:hypothetical protein
MWQQNYTPVGDSLGLSTLVAALPIFTLLLTAAVAIGSISPSKTSLLQENYLRVGYAVDRFVAAIECHFGCTPLLDCDQQYKFAFRRARKKAPSRKNSYSFKL